MMDFYELEDELKAAGSRSQVGQKAAEPKPKTPTAAPSILFARRQRWAELLKTKALATKNGPSTVPPPRRS